MKAHIGERHRKKNLPTGTIFLNRYQQLPIMHTCTHNYAIFHSLESHGTCIAMVGLFLGDFKTIALAFNVFR